MSSMTHSTSRPETGGDLPGPLFVWRGEDTVSWDFDYHSRNTSDGQEFYESALRMASVYKSFEHRCSFCLSKYLGVTGRPRPDYPYYYYSQQGPSICQVCGFTWEYSLEGLDLDTPYPGERSSIRFSILKRLTVNSTELTLHELGSHLKRRYRDVYHLDWRVFEELIADIYGGLGYETRLTAKTRDGGYDIMLSENSSGEQIVVECKRYRESRKVGIEIVDRILGVQLRHQIPKARIVTTSTFTSGAQAAASEAAQVGYALELFDASDLLAALQVYNAALPPLHLDPRFISCE